MGHRWLIRLDCHAWLREFLRWTLMVQLVSKVSMMVYNVFKVVRGGDIVLRRCVKWIEVLLISWCMVVLEL